jgi:hypothetical protein
MNQQPGSNRTTNLVQNEPIQRSITNKQYKETLQSVSIQERERLELLELGIDLDLLPD